VNIYDNQDNKNYSLSYFFCEYLEDVIYVSSSGVDINICGSYSLPCKSISEAFRRMKNDEGRSTTKSKIKIKKTSYILNEIMTEGNFVLTSEDETTNIYVNINDTL
jgi:hypothetical protein